ncbi:MAG: LacI family DNA-binding transcriptional regulator [Clostridiales bacterium]|nr:LacI family DNA-binding transcriptional regulator [Clostridiales bacterium]
MKKRVTINDIAEIVKVSSTTVSKALTGKDRIGEDTRRLILKTAEDLDYKANKVAQSLKRKPINVGVVIEDYFPDFSDNIVRGMEHVFEKLQDYKVEKIYSILGMATDKKVVVEELKRVASKGVDGIIFMPGKACLEYTEIVNEFKEKGIPVILMLSDLFNSNRIAVIRNNSRMVGDIGAQILGLLNNGKKNAMFIGNKDNTSHKDVIDGFVNRLKILDMDVVAVCETQNDNTVGYYVADKLLKDNPLIDGIFVGTIHSEGICRKIVEIGRAGKVKIVCTDVFPKVVEYIENDVVQATIFQDPFRQGKIAIEVMYSYLTEGVIPEPEIFINPRIIIKSNCKDYI